MKTVKFAKLFMRRPLRFVAAAASLTLLVLVFHSPQVSANGMTTLSGPSAPSPLAPANGAQVTVPFTISWSAVSDPSGIVAYNWQVSPSSSMSPVIEIDSTNGATQDTVSGLPNGTYFWRVQAVNGNFEQGGWSPTRSFNVTGANSGGPGSPTLNPIQGGTAFHPMEVFSFDWSAVAGAASYTVDAATDPNFPVATAVHINNIPDTHYSLQLGDSMPQGTWYLRVSAVNANGIQGVPSNLDTFTLSFNAPLPPPPNPLSPANGATVTLPVTLTWTDVPNPQPSGYVLEVAKDAGFNQIEYVNNQITGPHWTITSLSAGTKYWHVLSTQGDSAPGVPANTAWSATRSFVVPSTPAGVGSLAVAIDPASNGDMQTVTIQLTGPAPQGGAVVNLTSSDTTAAPVPATFTVPAGFAFSQFGFQVGQVSAPTQVTLTATLNGSSASVSFTVQPPGLKSLTISPTTITGGTQPTLIVMLSGAAPSGGTVVSLSSSNPSLTTVPSTVTIAPGNFSISVNIPTGAVTTYTVVTVSATLNGATLQSQVTLTPQQAPLSLALSPNPTTGSNGTFATVTVASPPSSDLTLPVTCSNSSVATCNTAVTIPAGATTGGFNIFTVPVTTQQVVTVSVTGAGVTKSATLTVQPTGSPSPTPTPGSGGSLSSLTLNPTRVNGGKSSTGTVTLSTAAPAGGVAVTLSSSKTSVATAPASVTIAEGATSATFTIKTTRPASDTTVTISATSNGVTQTARLTVRR